jgi:NADPH2:quinone reductase
MRLLIVQLAKALGARVIATVGDPVGATVAAGAGADEVLSWSEGRTAPRVRRLTGGRGIDVVYDAVGRATFAASLASLRPTGLYAQIAEVSGPVAPFDPVRLTAGSYLYCRPILAHYIARREDLIGRAAQVFSWIKDGTLTIRPGTRHPLDEAAQAHHELETRHAAAKPLLRPGRCAA